MTFIERPYPREFEEKLFSLIRMGFAQRRKKLINNLAAAHDKEKLAGTFSRLGLDANLRAENVPLASYIEMVKLLEG